MNKIKVGDNVRILEGAYIGKPGRLDAISDVQGVKFTHGVAGVAGCPFLVWFTEAQLEVVK